MRIKTNDQNISIELTPWTDNSFSIEWLQLREDLSGNLPYGKASLIFPMTDNCLSLITETKLGTVSIIDSDEGGFCFDKIPILITSRSYDKNSLIINFVCTPTPEFIEDRVSGYYENISNALSSIYPGTIDLRIESDENNNEKLHQCCETSFEFCKRIGYSLTEDLVFGFSWTGLLLKKIIGQNYEGKDESVDKNIPRLRGGGSGGLTNISPYTLTYSRKLNYQTINPWINEDNPTMTTYEDTEPKTVTSILGPSSYFICRKGFENMIVNYLQNMTKLSSNFCGNYVLSGTIMPKNYRLGDLVNYERSDDENKDSTYYTKCLVYSNEVFIGNGLNNITSPHGFNFEWTTELRGIEKGPWTIMKED